MRVYETGDVGFFVDKPNSWEQYCRYSSDKTWSHKSLKSPRSINYYRDLEGSRIQFISKKQLYLSQKPKNRINPWACLPLLYATGARFIKLEQSGPNGFKCSEFPMNVIEMRAKNVQLEIEARERRRQAYLKKMLKKECLGAARRKENLKYSN